MSNEKAGPAVTRIHREETSSYGNVIAMIIRHGEDDGTDRMDGTNGLAVQGQGFSCAGSGWRIALRSIRPTLATLAKGPQICTADQRV